jgi:hypothetical protein
MPDQPTWYQRLPIILEALESTAVPVIDRFTVERLFGVKRRQAIRIMARFGGYQAGRTFLIDRGEVLARLRSLAGGVPAASAIRRKERIWKALRREAASLRAKAVVIPALPPGPLDRTEAHLPAGVELRRGLLTIRYGQPVELLQKLYALSQAIANDYDAFEKLIQ